jgi:hypothetical protein
MHASTYRSQVAVQPPGQENDTSQGPTGLPSFGSPGAELTPSSALLSQQGMGNQAVQEMINASGQQSANKPPADKPPATNQSFAQHYAKWLNDRIAEVDKLPKDQQAKVARSLLLQTVQVGAKMKAGETVDLAKLSSSPNLSEHGVEKPDDLPEDWIFSTQRLLSRFDGGVPGLKFKAVSVNVPKYDQHTPGLGFEIGDNECFDTVREMVHDGGSGATVLNRDKRIQIGVAENEHGHLTSIDTSAAEQGTNYINQQLLDDRGVMVGVSHKKRNINVDKLTDHFVAITGHYTDQDGRVHYTFNEPGTKQEAKKTGTMTIDKDGRMVKKGDNKLKPVVDRPYEVSMVRPHEPLSEGKQPNSTTGVKQ